MTNKQPTDKDVLPPDFGDASPKNTNWAGAPTSDYRKLQKIFPNKNYQSITF